MFSKYEGFNDLKRKKLKSQPLKFSDLKMHAEAIYSLMLKPVVNSSPEWKTESDNFKQLANCMLLYSQYLEEQQRATTSYQALTHPVRTVGEHATVEHRSSGVTIKLKYSLLDAAMRETQLESPVFFDESVHVEEPFGNSVQKYRFFNELQLTVPVDIIRYCPGGPQVTTVCFFKVMEGRPESVILTQGARFLQKISSQLKEVHTRAQRAEFDSMVNNIAHISPAVKAFIYRTLTNDASAPVNPVMEERLRLISLGNTEIIDDLRHLNTGRPHAFDNFFQKLQEVVEEVTAADERRHKAVCHMSQWISLQEMIAQAAEKCEKDDLIPSPSLVRLQFAPRNPYTHRALNFTSKINVQYKIQSRQLRVSHLDAHYCAAQLKYLKEMSVELRDSALLFFCDDKAKVSIGEPKAPVSTGVRGRATIVPVNSTLCALDHDMTKASLTPSVYLKCDIPESAAQSFVQGEVTNIVNDSVFETSGPFRHAASIVRIAAKENKKILLRFTDGGTDQRNNLESVKCSSICIFRELDLDMLVHARCAPGQSWTNPAERIMSVLNLGLQNCALERQCCDEQTEKQFRKCNSMADIRSTAENDPSLKLKWKESVECTQSIVRNRFLRLSLKDKPMQAMDPVSEEEVDLLKRHLRELFPGMDLEKLQKVHTSKVVEYNEWLQRHTRQRHYCFQIRKCDDRSCCSEPLNKNLVWLPDPVLDESGDHYLPYSTLKSKETTEDDRPSLKKLPETQKKRKSSGAHTTATTEADAGMETENDSPSSLGIPRCSNSVITAQNARALVNCVECTKPRVLYSKQKLSQRQEVTLALSLSEYDYTCGGPVLSPNNSLAKCIQIRTEISCISPIEVPYYSSGIGRGDLCAYCATEDSQCNMELKKKYKTVLPLCGRCKAVGKKDIVYRPYGNPKQK